MKTPSPPPSRPRASVPERWEYVIMGGSNRPPAPRVEASARDIGVHSIGSTPALVFLSVVLTVVILAPQTPGAHNWAAERAVQQAGAGVTP